MKSVCAALLASVVAATLSQSVHAETVSVVVRSDPQGATVYANESGQPMGYSPVTVKYQVPKGFFKGDDCLVAQSMRVRWASGAEASIDSFQICPSNGKTQQLVFARPQGLSGAEIDAFFALELQRLALVEREAKSARRAEAWQRYRETLARQQAQNAARLAELQRQMQIVHCESRLVGNTLMTDCR